MDRRYGRQDEFKPTKSDLKRQAIVEAGIKSIGTDGLRGLSFEKLTKETGLRRSHINYYFGNLDDLISACIKEVVAAGQEYTVNALQTAKTPKQFLKSYIAVTYKWLDEHPTHASVMLALYYQATYSRDYERLNTEIHKFSIIRIAEILRVMQGKIEADRGILSLAEKTRNALVGDIMAFLCTDSQRSAAEWTRATSKKIMALIASES